MLDAAVKALSQMFSPPFRTVLWKSVGLALVLIVIIGIAVQRLLVWLATYGTDWAEGLLGFTSKRYGRFVSVRHHSPVSGISSFGKLDEKICRNVTRLRHPIQG